MKKIIKYYYIFLEILLFVCCILESKDFYFSGILYHVSMLLFIGLSVFVVVKFNSSLKLKKVFYVTLIIYSLIISNVYLFLLLLILFFVIMILNYKSKFICYTFSFISILACICLPITMILILMKFDGVGIHGSAIRNGIYDEYYYKCGKYEIFYYSGGAMDRFHYAVMKRHRYIEIDKIITIGYDELVGDTLEEYNEMLKNNKCEEVK